MASIVLVKIPNPLQEMRNDILAHFWETHIKVTN